MAAAVGRCGRARPAHLQLGSAADPDRLAGRARALAADRRSISDPTEIAYYVCYAPRRSGLHTLAWIAGSRWHVEECLQQAKNEAGLDHYQVRTWRAWYAHITLSMLALTWLALSMLALSWLATAKARATKGESAPTTRT